MESAKYVGASQPQAERSSNSPNDDDAPDQQLQYMGSYVQGPMSLNVSPLCNFRVPSPDFHVPPLRCSFPSLLHPHYELVKEQCDAWTLGFVQPHSPAARRLLIDCLLPRLLCRNIPIASSLCRLIQVTKMISWLIIADDEDDRPDALGADVAGITQSAASVMAILRSHQDSPMTAIHGEEHQLSPKVSIGSPNKSSKTSESKARALEALALLWGEMHIGMPPNLRARFISTMADYFDAIKVQATYRQVHQLPYMEAYMDIRRQASFILPAFSLVEYAMGIELDENVYAHPQLQEFRNTAVDYICLCNDILSCRVEIGVGDYFNMPSIVYNTCASSTFQEAINFSASMVEELDTRLVSMVASIHQSSLPSLQCPSLKAYVNALGSCMSGCLAWFLETARYNCNP
nr:microbial terpene synthase-like protein 8 [Dryopteris fragrans]